eukprot:gene13767-biopygen3569
MRVTNVQGSAVATDSQILSALRSAGSGALELTVTFEPLQLELWQFGGRQYPVIPITASEAATLRNLQVELRRTPDGHLWSRKQYLARYGRTDEWAAAPHRQGRRAHGLHHLGQVCRSQQDGTHMLEQFDPSPLEG